MNHIIQLMQWNWHFFIPFLLVFLPLLVAECLKREHEDAGKSGMLKICLQLVPMTLAGMVLFFVSGMASSRLNSMLLMILVQTIAVGIPVLAEYRLAGLSSFKKRKRIFVLLLMFTLYMIETVLLIYIVSGMTT